MKTYLKAIEIKKRQMKYGTMLNNAVELASQTLPKPSKLLQSCCDSLELVSRERKLSTTPKAADLSSLIYGLKSRVLGSRSMALRIIDALNTIESEIYTLESRVSELSASPTKPSSTAARKSRRRSGR